MNARLQHAQRLIEEAQQDLEVARNEVSPARDSHEDLTFRSALNRLASAHVCVVGILNRAAVAGGAKERRALGRVFGYDNGR